MLTTYCLFPTAAGDMETCTERAESPPPYLMLASQPGHGSVRTLLPPKPGTPCQSGAQTFKEEKQVARSTAKSRKARQTVSRNGWSDLNPAKWKADSPEGRGTPATLSHHLNSQDFSSLWTTRAGKDGGEPLPLSSPQFTPPAGGEPPAAAPGTSLGTPHELSLG